MCISCITYAQASAYGGQSALDVNALRKVGQPSPGSLYLIMPASIGGCLTCIAENPGRRQHILDRASRHMADRTVLLQLVGVERMIEFTSLRNTYPDIEGVTPDVRSVINGTVFGDTVFGDTKPWSSCFSWARNKPHSMMKRGCTKPYARSASASDNPSDGNDVARAPMTWFRRHHCFVTLHRTSIGVARKEMAYLPSEETVKLPVHESPWASTWSDGPTAL